jgi:DNA (cytosine-5)-methyltransferase 1
VELKRIQSFPDSFTFIGSKKERYTQIGNAVPPKLAYFLGKEMIKFLKHLNNGTL